MTYMYIRLASVAIISFDVKSSYGAVITNSSSESAARIYLKIISPDECKMENKFNLW